MSSINIPAPGILNNDAGDVASGATLTYNASTDPNTTDNQWADEEGVANFDWTFAGTEGTNYEYISNPTTSLPGITGSYNFIPGNALGADTGDWGPFNENDDATFEMWFRPSDLTGNHVLWETGGQGNGFAIYLEGSFVKAVAKNSAGAPVVSFDLNSLGASEFIQVAAVFTVNNELKLYVNGELADTKNAVGVNDWTGGNNAGLGKVGSNSVAASGPTFTNYEGEIAIFRYYESNALSDAAIRDNYQSIALSVSQFETQPDEAQNVVGTYGTADWAADGSLVYTIDPANLEIAELRIGQTRTDTFTYTVTDSVNNTDTTTVTIIINGKFEAPVLDLDGNDSSGATGKDFITTFITDSPAPVPIADTDIALTDEPGSTFPSITITPAVSGGFDTDETLRFVGTSNLEFDLDTDSSGAVTIGAATYNISYTSGVISITKSGGDMTEAEVLAVLGAAEYENTSSTINAGNRTFTITTTDGTNVSPDAVATVVVTPGETDPPIATNEAVSVDEGASVLIDLTDNVSDAGSGVVLSTVDLDGAAPADGTLVDNGDGTFTYTHDGSEPPGGTIDFNYTVQDALGNESTPATVSITVNPINDAPVITNLDGDSQGYVLGSGVKLIDLGANATVTDAENSYNSGVFTVEYAGSGGSNDQLTIEATYGVTTTGAPGADVNFGGQVIGTIGTDGTNGSNLTVNLNGNATNAALTALAQSIGYTNTGAIGFSTAIKISVTDDVGAQSNVATVTIQNKLAAVDDADSTDEDTVLSNATVATGVLGNDINTITSDVFLSFDAGEDPAQGDGTWPNNEGIGSHDLTFGVSPTVVSNAEPTFPGISDAYQFGSGEVATMSSLSNLSGDPSNNNASVELWIKPDDLVSGNQMIFETGNGTDGLALYLENNVLKATVQDGGVSRTIQHTLTSTAQFTQVVLTVDMTADTFRIYVDGTEIAQGDNSFTGADWSQNDTAALGGTSGTDVLGGTHGEFSGQIALFRLYQVALTATEVQDNYNVVSNNDGKQGLTVIAAEDVDMDTITINSAFTTSLGASLTINSNGTYSYDPTGSASLQALAVGESATETFTYTIQNYDGDTDTATLVITTTGVNDAPVTSNSTATTTEDITLTLALSDFPFSDVDTSDNIDTVRILTLPSDGTLELSGNVVSANDVISASEITAGNLTFVPNADQAGTPLTTLTFSVNDGTADSTNTGTLTINVTPENDPPTTGNNTVTTTEDITLTFALSDFPFADVDSGDAIETVTIKSLPGSGTLELDGSAISGNDVISVADITAGNLTFVPDPDDNGSPYTTFSFVVGDGEADSTSSATMTVNVNQVDDPVTIGGDTSGGGDEDAGAITGTLTATDAADGLTDGTIFTATNGTNGSASIDASSGAWSYTPNADFNGTDSFTVTVTDDDGNTATQSISVSVTAVADITSDSLSVSEDSSVIANVLTGTNGATADTFEGSESVTSVTQGTNGSVCRSVLVAM